MLAESFSCSPPGPHKPVNIKHWCIVRAKCKYMWLPRMCCSRYIYRTRGQYWSTLNHTHITWARRDEFIRNSSTSITMHWFDCHFVFWAILVFSSYFPPHHLGYLIASVIDWHIRRTSRRNQPLTSSPFLALAPHTHPLQDNCKLTWIGILVSPRRLALSRPLCVRYHTSDGSSTAKMLKKSFRKTLFVVDSSANTVRLLHVSSGIRPCACPVDTNADVHTNNTRLLLVSFSWTDRFLESSVAGLWGMGESSKTTSGEYQWTQVSGTQCTLLCCDLSCPMIA